MSARVMVAVAHGTRVAAGAETVRALLGRVRALRPWLEVRECYAELAQPVLEEAVAAAGGPVVAVPLMLGRGYHALVDIPGRLPPDAIVARPLGPHSLLAAALADRLGPGRKADAVVLGAAGSSDPVGLADVRVAARLLSRRLQRQVRYGLVTGDTAPLASVVEEVGRTARRVAVASYLLAPGFFHDRMAACGADLISEPLGDHDAVARLVLRRYDEALLRSGMAAAS